MAATIGPLSPTYSTADDERSDIRQLPVAFEAIDQDAASPRYLARFPNYDVLLDSRSVAVRLSDPTIRAPRGLNRPTSPNTATLKLSFHGTSKASVPVGNDKLRGKANYFIGKDPKKWMRGVPLYGSVLYPDVYPGVDFIFQNNNGRLGYRVQLDHGDAVHEIALRFSGHDAIRLNAQGEIEIATAVGLATWTAPKAFWETAQGLIRAEATYAIRDDGSVGFEIEGPIRPDPLIIDLDLVFSTFIGGSAGDFINGLALAENGNIVVTGATNSLNFPLSANAAQSNNAGFLDIFVTMLRPDASEIVFSTYLGGQSLDAPNGIVIMADGSISICGFTGSPDFPTSLNAIQANSSVLPDTFVSQLSESGDTLRFSSYFGGSSDDNCTSMVVDGQNRVLITGYTASTDFPITPSAMSTQHQGGLMGFLEYDGFFSVLQLDQPSIAYSTFVGGSGSELQVVQFVGPEVEGLAFELGPWLTTDDEGNVYLAGTTDSADFLAPVRGSAGAFIIKLAAEDYSLVASTLLDGNRLDAALSIAISEDGKVVVGGITSSSDFPASSGAFQPTFGGGQNDGFLAVLDSNLQVLEYGTYIGGGGFDAFFANVAAENRIHIGGVTSSSDLPSSPDAWQPGFAGVLATYFLTFNLSTNSVEFSTYIGGSGQEVLSRPMTTSDGGVLLFGGTSSPEFKTTSGVIGENYSGGQSDGAIVKFAEPGPGPPGPRITSGGVVVGNLLPTISSISPTSIISIFGSEFAPEGFSDTDTQTDAGGLVATNQSGVCVEIGGVRAPMFHVFPNQLNVQAPSIEGKSPASVVVVTGCDTPEEQRSAAESVPLVALTPAFFVTDFVDAGGANPIAALHQDGVGVVGDPGIRPGSTPAAPGEFISLFGTGFGPTNPPLQAGAIPGGLADIAGEFTVTIGGAPVTGRSIFYAGIAPCCAGLYQIVVRVPMDAADGNHEVIASVDGMSTPSGPFVAVKR